MLLNYQATPGFLVFLLFINHKITKIILKQHVKNSSYAINVSNDCGMTIRTAVANTLWERMLHNYNENSFSLEVVNHERN